MCVWGLLCKSSCFLSVFVSFFFRCAWLWELWASPTLHSRGRGKNVAPGRPAHSQDATPPSEKVSTYVPPRGKRGKMGRYRHYRKAIHSIFLGIIREHAGWH